MNLVDGTADSDCVSVHDFGANWSSMYASVVFVCSSTVRTEESKNSSYLCFFQSYLLIVYTQKPRMSRKNDENEILIALTLLAFQRIDIYLWFEGPGDFAG